VSTARWKQLAKSFADSSPRVRARAIETADLEIGVMRTSQGLPTKEDRRTELPALPKAFPLKANGRLVRPDGQISFNGGRILGSQRVRGFAIYQRFETFSWSEPQLDEGEADAIAVLHGEKARVVIRHADATAYTVSATRDGTRWDTWKGPPGTRIVDVYRDRMRNKIELLLWDGAFTGYRVWISLRGEPEVSRMDSYVVGGREVCRHLDHVWRFDGNHVSHLDHARVDHDRLSASVPDARVDCRRDRSLVLHRSNGLERDVLERCGSDCFRVFYSTSRVPGFAGLLDDQTWIYAAASEGVVAIHREGKPTELYRLPVSDHQVVAITVLDRPYLVIDERTSYSLVSIP
jgi:hypothetical protein